MLQFDDFWQISQIALHREHAVNDYELDSFRTAFLQLLLQVFHVVMLVYQASGKRQSPAIYNTGMVTLIANYIVFSATDDREDS